MSKSIIPHENWFRLMTFIEFWDHELQMHPYDRFQPAEYVHNVFDRHTRNIREIGQIILAKQPNDKGNFTWKGYKNINITSDLESDVEKFVEDDKNVFYSFNEMLVTGYQIKIYFDEKNESMKALATCFDADSVNYGYAMSAWAGDWYTALAVLIFKHYEVADKIWEDGTVTKVNKFG